MLQRLGKSRRGFTLPELAIVMGIIGIVLSALWAVSGDVHEKQRTNDAVAELQFSAAGIIGILQGQALAAPYGNTQYMTTQMLNGNAIPSQYRNPASAAPKTAANHPWGTGLFRVYKAGADAFRIAFYIVPEDGCIQLLTHGTSCTAGTLGCPQRVLVENGSETRTPDAVTGWQVMTVAEAQTLCEHNTFPTTDETENSVEFEYSLH